MMYDWDWLVVDSLPDSFILTFANLLRQVFNLIKEFYLNGQMLLEKFDNPISLIIFRITLVDLCQDLATSAPHRFVATLSSRAAVMRFSFCTLSFLIRSLVALCDSRSVLRIDQICDSRGNCTVERRGNVVKVIIFPSFCVSLWIYLYFVFAIFKGEVIPRTDMRFTVLPTITSESSKIQYLSSFAGIMK